jgi:hypothetical protein
MKGAVQQPARYDGRDRPPINSLIQKASAVFPLCSDRISSCDSSMGPNHRILSVSVRATNALPFYGLAISTIQNVFLPDGVGREEVWNWILWVASTGASQRDKMTEILCCATTNYNGCMMDSATWSCLAACLSLLGIVLVPTNGFSNLNRRFGCKCYQTKCDDIT